MRDHGRMMMNYGQQTSKNKLISLLQMMESSTCHMINSWTHSHLGKLQCIKTGNILHTQKRALQRTITAKQRITNISLQVALTKKWLLLLISKTKDNCQAAANNQSTSTISLLMMKEKGVRCSLKKASIEDMDTVRQHYK